MAILEVQTNDSKGLVASAVAWNLTSNVTAGNAVVLCIATSTPGNSVSAVTGCGITNWALIGTHSTVTSGEGLEIWWGSGSTGGSKAITITVVGGAYSQATEFSGVGTLGSTAAGVAASQALAATTGQLVVAGIVSTNAFTAFTGLTTDYNGTATGPSWRWTSGLDSAYQIVSSTATVTPTWTISGSGNKAVRVVSFNPASSDQAGTASGTVSFTGAAVATLEADVTAAGSVSFTGVATETVQEVATATGVLSFTGAGVVSQTSVTPLIRGTGSGTQGSSATIAVSLSANPVAGDCVIIRCAGRASSDLWSAPGFTAVSVNTSSGNFTQQLLYRNCDGSGSDPTTAGITVTNNATTRMVANLVIVEQATFDPLPTVSGQANTSALAITAPSLTSTVDGDLLIWFGLVVAATGVTPQTIVAPAGYTIVGSQANTTSGASPNVGAVAATISQPTAGATGTIAGSVAVAAINGGTLIALTTGTAVPVTAAGALSFTGAATTAVSEPVTAAGALVFTGAATATQSFTSTAAGSLAFTGAATETVQATVTAASTVSITGAATAAVSEPATAAGALAFTGAGSSTVAIAATAVGSVAITGAAAVTVKLALTAVGALAFTGAGAAVVVETVTASGSLSFIGAAAVTVKTVLTASGTVLLTGTAISIFGQLWTSSSTSSWAVSKIPTTPALDLSAKASAWAAALGGTSSSILLDHIADGYGIVFYNSLTASQFEAFNFTSSTVTNWTAWGETALNGSLPVPMGSLLTNSIPTGYDGYLVIIDEINGVEIDIWQATQSGGHLTGCTWGDVYSLTGDALHSVSGPTTAGVGRGSGFAVSPLVILDSELKAGVIPHPIGFSCKFTLTASDPSGGFVSPALKSDGVTLATAVPPGIPVGTRVQLDPTINLSAITGITPTELMIGVAFQQYGGYVYDTGGTNISIGVQTDTTAIQQYGSSYLDTNGVWDYYNMPHIPWTSLRVLSSTGATIFSALSTVSFTGTATTAVSEPATASGTVSFVGAAIEAVQETATAIGTVTFTGTATANQTGFTTASSTVAMTGAGAVAVQLTVTASSTVTVTGAATTTVKIAVSASGTVAFTGAGTLPLVLSSTAAGALVFTGAGVAAVNLLTTAASTVVFTGAGTATQLFTSTAAGSLVFVGSATANQAGFSSAAGVLAFTGAATLGLAVVLTAANILLITGVAALTPVLSLIASASLALTGAATAASGSGTAAVGSLSFLGAAGGTLAVPTTASGVILVAGAAIVAQNMPATATGTIVITSSASLVVVSSLTANGTINITGDGIVEVGAAGVTATSTIVLVGAAASTPVFTKTASAMLMLTASATVRTSEFMTALGLLLLVGVAHAVNPAAIPDSPVKVVYMQARNLHFMIQARQNVFALKERNLTVKVQKS